MEKETLIETFRLSLYNDRGVKKIKILRKKGNFFFGVITPVFSSHGATYG